MTFRDLELLLPPITPKAWAVIMVVSGALWFAAGISVGAVLWL